MFEGDPDASPTTSANRARQVRELVAGMTLEEKAGQLSATVLPPPGTAFDPARLEHPPGLVLVPPMPTAESAARVRALQDALGATRLGIGALTMAMGRRRSLGFSGALGAAATWDVTTVGRLAADDAAELRRAGVLATAAAVADDTGPGLAPDAVLAAAIGAAQVRGAQGTHSGIGSRIGSAQVALAVRTGLAEDGSWHERTLRSTLLLAAEAAVRAGAAIVLPPVTTNAGVPGHIDSWLLSTVLRDEWGFSGPVVSSPGGVEDLVRRQGVAESVDQALATALESGVDVFAPGVDAAARIVALVRDGSLAPWVVDDSVAALLEVKQRLGLLDRIPRRRALPAPDRREAPPAADPAPGGPTPAALVLLSDPTGTLPLGATGSVHVVALADGMQHAGAWGSPGSEGTADSTATPPPVQELARALKAVLPRSVVRAGLPGSTVDARGDTVVVLTVDPAGVAPAVARLVAAGRRCVVLVRGDRIDELDDLATTSATVMLCWRRVTDDADMIAAVLAGALEPGGRLPLALPVSPTPRSVTFPLGHGNGYTTFHYARLSITPHPLLGRESIRVRCSVTNTGTRAGREVVQVYLGHRTNAFAGTGPSLAGFGTVRLAPGQTASVVVPVPAARMAIWDHGMRHVLQPGTVEVLVGRSASDIRLSGVLEIDSTDDVDERY